MKKKKNGRLQLNSAGMTMVELTVTFAILGLFLVAATRIISYTINIYYAAKGASYGLEVSNMIANKIVGMTEGAESMPQIKENGEAVSFTDTTGSQVTIGTAEQEGGTYLNIHYEPSSYQNIEYEATDFKFDTKTYMGYEIESLVFSHPDGEGTGDGKKAYPDNVIRMELVLKSEKYGSYRTTRYMKCVKVQ